MGVSEHEYVNFSEDYELNYRLRVNDLRQTEENRTALIQLGDELKAALNKARITHGELQNVMPGNMGRFQRVKT